MNFVNETQMESLPQGSLRQRLLSFLFSPHSSIKDIAGQRRAQLSSILAFVLTCTNAISLYFVGREGLNATFYIQVTLTVVSIVAYFISRLPRFVWGSVILVSSLSLSGFANVLSGSDDPASALYTTVPVALAIGSALLPVWGNVVQFIASAVGVMLLPVIHPIYTFGDAGDAMSVIVTIGVLLIVVQIFRNNLERARLEEVQIINQELRELGSTLEQRVETRTQNLELAAEVGRTVSQLRDLDIMLQDACDLIQREFDLYYVQVYLTDPTKRNLILEAGTGEIGAQLRERGHSLQLNTGSINGRAAVEKRSVVISDTAESEVFHPNQLLPETRGEMAVPLVVGGDVVGVLDVQSKHPGKLTEEVLPAFEALAGQLAVAIQNAALVVEAERARKGAEQARAEVEAQARRLVRTGWSEYMDAIHKPEQVGFLFDHNEVTPLEDVEDPPLLEDGQAVTAPISLTGEMLGSLVVELDEEHQNEHTGELVNTVARQVAQQLENLRLLESAERYRFEAEQAARRQTREGWQEYLASRGEANLGYLYDLKQVRPYSNGKDDADALTLPLKTRDETVGKLSVQGLNPNDRESFDLASAVVERLGAHIESLRQYDRTQSALAQSERLFNASSRLTQATDLQELVEAAVTTLEIPEVNRALLTTFDYDSEGEVEQLSVIANWWSGEGHEITPIGTRYPLEVIRVMPMFVSPTPVFFNDTFDDERVDETTMELVKKLNLRAVAVLPLHLGSRQIGALILEAEEPHNFTPDETRLFESLAPQIATVLENRQQYERAQRQAEREAMLNAINQKIQSATSVEAVLQIAARELGHALGAPMTIAQLGMKGQKN